MVRFKKRYFVVQLDRESDLAYSYGRSHQHFQSSKAGDPSGSDSQNGRGRKNRIARHPRRPLLDPNPLNVPDGLLVRLLKEKVQDLHGDFGRAAVATGLRTIYCNPETRLMLIQCRHGPHRLVASAIPFVTKVKDVKVVPRTIYTGATIRNCYRKMLEHQRKELNSLLQHLGDDHLGQETKKELEERLMSFRQMSHGGTKAST